MKLEIQTTHIDMQPGDRIRINVGMLTKCDIEVKPDGKLRMYYQEGSLEI